MYDFSGKVAVVTGAAAGLGYATVQRLRQEGASVLLVDRDKEGVEAAASRLSSATKEACGLVADVSVEDDVDAAIRFAEAEIGPVDFLVNNAGITVIRPYVDHTNDDFDRQIAVNLRGAHLFMQRVLPSMIERGSGAIVNISSAAALHYTVPHAGYAASKAGLIALTRDVAFEVASKGVRVNGIAPGLIAVPPSSTKTPYLAGKTQAAGGELRAPTTTRPLGHGKPADIASAVAFLLSEEARFIIGVTIPVAGGTDLQVSMAYPGDPIE